MLKTIFFILGILITTPSFSQNFGGGEFGSPLADPFKRVGSNAILNASGNVGIGSDNPGTKVDVTGTVRATAFSGDGSAITGVTSGGWTDAGTTVRLTTSTDNVGINSTAPRYKLDVVGNVGVGTFIVTQNVATFNSEYTLASNIGIGTTTINWNNGNYQNVGIGTHSGAHVAFTPPTNGNLGKLQLRIKQDATGSRIIDSWPAAVLWSGGSAPTLTTTANKSDIINCTWNGTNYYCGATLNF